MIELECQTRPKQIKLSNNNSNNDN